MSTLEKTVFIADAISSDRNYPSLNSIKEAAENSLEKAILVNTRSIIKDFAEKNLEFKKNVQEPEQELEEK